MEHEKLFDAGGILFILTGVLTFFLWVVAFAKLFPAVGGIEQFIPTYDALRAGETLTMVKNVVFTLSMIFGSFALILAGIGFMKIPKMVAQPKPMGEDLQDKMNRLQNIVWKLMQRMKE